MSAPRYKPRSELQTRQGSDGALEAVPDFAATALDRPVASDADIRQAQLKQDVARGRREQEASQRGRRVLIVGVAVVVGLALFVGALLGAYLATR